MRRAIFLTLVLASSAFADVKTGELDLTFTQRSPLSSAKTLTDRLVFRSAGDDDDLANTHFLAYVPPATTEPMGLIVWLNYRAADVLPKSIEPVLDRTHTIFVVAKTANQDPWARVALSIDADYNLKQQYTIDERRTYLFSLLQPDDTTGQQMGLAFPDAFAGFVYILNFRYFRPISAGGTAYAASFARPASGALVGQSKLRKHLLVGDLTLSDTNHLVQKAYWQDGFADTQLLEIPPAAVTYPKLDADFFAKILSTLTIAATPSTPQPATKPIEPVAVDSDAQRMLSLAKNLIAAGSNDAARAKLRDLIAQFPNDPSVTEAKRLLDDLNKQ